MGSITDNYATLSQVLLTEYQSKKSPARDLFHQHVIKPILPAAFRTGRGQVSDVKDRILGPFDIIGCSEVFPPLGEGMSSQFLADGVSFILQVRNWKEEDLTQFAAMAGKLKALIRRSKTPLFCAVVGFESLPAKQVAEFMKSSAGQAVDGMLTIGQHVMLRNNQGWYGDPKTVPYVTEQGEGESLKSFVFWMTHLLQTALNIPYPLGDYQHL